MPSLAAIQILRGIAAWLVVYHHYLQIFYHFETHSWLGRFFSHYGLIGVDIFFIISGFVMTYSLTLKPRTAGMFWWARLKRIVPAYWLYTLVALAAVELLTPPAFYPWTARSLILSLLFIPHTNPMGFSLFPFLLVGWTLNYEMFFYSLLALNLFCWQRFSIAITALLCTLIPFYWPEHWPLAAFFCSSRLTEFSLGMLLAYLYLNTTFFKTPKAQLFGLVYLCLFLPFTYTQPFIFLEFVALILVCTALSLENKLNAKQTIIKKLITLGEISYSTYLSHYIVTYIAYLFLQPPFSQMAELCLILAISVCTLGLSYLSYQYIEKSNLFK